MNAGNGKHAAILNITLDRADARAQASFWAAALGWIAQEHDDVSGHVEYLVESPAGKATASGNACEITECGWITRR